MPRLFKVRLTETVNYTMLVEADTEEEASEEARELWAQSEDPTTSWSGQGQGVEVQYAEIIA